ncbi:GNAT family N-acetyltransferase [Ascidiimonas sp. W6]|uniref:GNAT family N-acetyltransferase n=1 Tax=Ascidiimonas meishanensis TaxID=3128903 RepID=UPI0030ED1F3C
MEIIQATHLQLPEISEMAQIIWPYNYKNMISAAQIDYMLDLMYSNASLKEQLQKNHVFLIAKENKKPVGFASYEANFENKQETRLHKIYVLPETQGKGIGRKMLYEVIRISSKNGDKKISLTVNRTNPAVQFYKNLGFKITNSVDMEIGNGFLMEDYIMKKKL